MGENGSKIVGRFSEASKQGFQRRLKNRLEKLLFQPSPTKNDFPGQKAIFLAKNHAKILDKSNENHENHNNLGARGSPRAHSV